MSLALKRAVELQNQGSLDEAEEAYRTILATQPNHFDALHLLGVLRSRQGRNVEALQYLSAALRVNHTDFAAWSNLGIAQARIGQLEEALASFDKAVALKPDYAGAHNNRGNILMALKRLEEALASYERAIALEPASAGAHSNRGNALLGLNRPEEALASYHAALSLSPNFVEAHNNRGNAFLDLKRPADALASFDRALVLAPDYAEVYSNRSNALRDLEHLHDALASCDKALALRPDYPEALNNRGNTLIALGRPKDALASYERALALKPDYAEVLNNCGGALTELKRPLEALARCDSALALRPSYAEAYNNRGAALRDLDRPEEALASCDRALTLKPNYPEGHNNRGAALIELNRPEEALASFDQAIALNPDYAVAYDSKGTLLTELGRFDQARSAFEVAIKLAPSRVRSYYGLTLSKRLTPGDPSVRAMEALARDILSLSTDEQIFLHFALAKTFADIEDRERSFRHLLDGNALKRAQTTYDEAATRKLFERTRAAFTGELMRRNEGLGDSSSMPVFIIGMPRSGTTLVEQILASHPKVFGAGETNEFTRVIAEVGGASGWALHGYDSVSRMSAEQLRELGARYLERIRAVALMAERITNKAMENFRVIGAIRLALPNARIIHVRRDPVDTCFSCFSHLFFGNLPYTYDLGELGRYYVEYDALMAHWRGVAPPDTILDVQYEEVVADLEGQARRIVAHCGLGWDTRCLEFHRTERQVRTASATQVRQPIYGSSVGRWRAYESFLEPLLIELGPLVAPGASGRRAPRALQSR